MDTKNEIVTPKKEKKTVKFLSASNVWNTKALLRARTKGDGNVVLCTATKKELYYIKKKSGTKVMLNSHGECCECKNIFHEEYIFTFDGTDKTNYPIELCGFYCLDCWKKD